MRPKAESLGGEGSVIFWKWSKQVPDSTSWPRQRGWGGGKEGAREREWPPFELVVREAGSPERASFPEELGGEGNCSQKTNTRALPMLEFKGAWERVSVVRGWETG